MRLAKINEFRRMVYTEDSAPSETTVRRRIDRGQIPGGTVDHGRYYVDMDEFCRATNLRANLSAQQAALARHPLLEGLVE